MWKQLNRLNRSFCVNSSQICTKSVLLLWLGSLLCGKWYYYHSPSVSVSWRSNCCFRGFSALTRIQFWEEMLTCKDTEYQHKMSARYNLKKCHFWLSRKANIGQWFDSVCIQDLTETLSCMHTHMHNQAIPLPFSTPSAYVSIWFPP